MIGIYKITSPSGKIYVGQSVNIEKRFKGYKKLRCNKQPRLINSFLKYGVENHKFEVIEKCDIIYLNKKERYYQDFFNCVSNKGLNCQLTKTEDLSGKHSDITKIKIGLKSKGRVVSEKTREKISLSNKGRIVSIETRIKMSLITKNQSKESLIKKAISNTGKRRSQESKDVMNAKKRALILNLETGIFYEGIKHAAFVVNLKTNTLKCKLNGQNKNNTSFVYV